MNYHATLLAQEMAAPLDVSAELANNLFTANNVWMMLCTALVFYYAPRICHARDRIWSSQEHCQYLIKNTVTPVIGILTYAMVGFFLMYPGFEAPEWFSFNSAGWICFGSLLGMQM